MGDLREAASDIFVQTVNLSSSVGLESSEVNENGSVQFNFIIHTL